MREYFCLTSPKYASLITSDEIFFPPDGKILQDYVCFLIRGYSYHLSCWIPVAIGLVSFVSNLKNILWDTLAPALIFLTLSICVHPEENTLGLAIFFWQTPQGRVQVKWGLGLFCPAFLWWGDSGSLDKTRHHRKPLTTLHPCEAFRGGNQRGDELGDSFSWALGMTKAWQMAVYANPPDWRTIGSWDSPTSTSVQHLRPRWNHNRSSPGHQPRLEHTEQVEFYLLCFLLQQCSANIV